MLFRQGKENLSLNIKGKELVGNSITSRLLVDSILRDCLCIAQGREVHNSIDVDRKQ